MSFRDDIKEANARNGPWMVLFRDKANVFCNNGDGAFMVSKCKGEGRRRERLL